MDFEIVPFIITDVKNDLVLQNANSITIIKDTLMKNMLTEIDKNSVDIISEEYLKNIFNENYKEAQDFLLSNKVIKLIKEKNLLYNDVKIIVNDKKLMESLTFNIKGINIKYSIDLWRDSIFDENLNESTMYFVVLNPFNLKKYKKIVNKFRDSNVLCKFAFFYNHSFYVSNFYKNEWKNPCPICYFSHIEGYLRADSKINETINFQTIIDIVYSEKPKFEVVKKFSNYEYSYIVQIIFKEVIKMNKYNLNDILVMDLNNYEISYDTALHWELCDCYE